MDVRLFITLGKAFPLSLISFQLAQSNSTTCQSVELDGQSTSPLPSQSCPSETVKENGVEPASVKSIVTVVIFPDLELVTLDIQFPVSPVAHLSPFGIVKSNTAAELVPLFVTEALVHA